MSKIAAAALAVLLLTASPFAYAQTGSSAAQDQSSEAQDQSNASDANAVTDARIEVVKYALQLTPSQEKLWPAIEEAIRNRAKNRLTRLYNFAGRADQLRSNPVQGLLNRNPIDFMQRRADALEQRSRDLKQLADAWQPLYQTLSPDQRKRMALLTITVLRQVRNGLQGRGDDFGDADEQ